MKLRALPPTSLALIAGLALVVLSLAAGDLRAEDRADLEVKKAKVRLRPLAEGKSPRHTLNIQCTFASQVLDWFRFDPDAYEVVVTLGGVQVLPDPGASADGIWKRKGVTEGWTYKEKKSAGREGVRKLFLDVGGGRFTLKAKGMDLSAMRASGPDAVPVTLTLDGVEFSTVIEMNVKGSAWSFKGKKSGFVFVPGGMAGGGGGGGGGTGGGGTSGLSWRILGQRIAPARQPRAGSLFREVGDQGLWSSFWTTVIGQTGSAPAVDFSKEVVILMVTERLSTTGFEINVLGAAETPGGVHVNYELGIPDSSCSPQPFLNSVFVVIAVTRYEGVPRYDISTRSRSCP